MLNTIQLLSRARKAPEFWIEPDAFLRYLPVIERIKYYTKKNTSRKIPIKILEIGSGDFGLSTYVSHPVTKVDLVFRKSPALISPKIKANGCALPFREKTFDAVFAVDLMEHVMVKERLQIIQEMIRVGKREVLLIFPSGKRAREQDLKIAADFQRKNGRPFQVLEEHQKIDFPEMDEINKYCECNVSSKVSIATRSSFNLTLREKLIHGWLEGRTWVQVVSFALLSFPLLYKLFDIGNCYRKVVSIKIKDCSPKDQTLRFLRKTEKNESIVNPTRR